MAAVMFAAAGWFAYLAFMEPPETVLGAILAVVFFLIGLEGPLFYFSGAVTLVELGESQDGWKLSPFIGKSIVRKPDQLKVVGVWRFSRWDRFFRVTSLLSRTGDNYAIKDLGSGKTYYANGDYLGKCVAAFQR